MSKANEIAIKIYFCHGSYLIWDPETVFLIRFRLRIVGNLVGSFPNKPRQNGQFSLPLQLSNIEAKLLLNNCNADIVTSSFNASDVELEKYQQKIEEKRAIHFEAQTKYKQELKNIKLNKLAQSIQQGQLKKLGKRKNRPGTSDNLTEQNDFESFKVKEINKVKKYNIDQTLIKMEIQSIFSCADTNCNDIVLSPEENLKYAVFTNLYNRGYYLTDGLKFGGDYLVYPGDPGLYHSLYIVVCVPDNKHLSALEYSAMGRLATSVKKTLLLCSQNENGELILTSMDWSGLV